MNLISNCGEEDTARNGGKIQYSRSELLQIWQQNITTLPNKDITVLDNNYLAICSANQYKPTHRGSKGLKRLYNIRQREFNCPVQYLRSLTKVEENVNKPRSNTRDKQIPALVLTNCRSITLDKLDELKLFIESKHSQIVMLTESWLNKSKEQTRCIDDFEIADVQSKLWQNRRRRGYVCS